MPYTALVQKRNEWQNGEQNEPNMWNKTSYCADPFVKPTWIYRVHLAGRLTLCIKIKRAGVNTIHKKHAVLCFILTQILNSRCRAVACFAIVTTAYQSDLALYNFIAFLMTYIVVCTSRPGFGIPPHRASVTHGQPHVYFIPDFTHPRMLPFMNEQGEMRLCMNGNAAAQIRSYSNIVWGEKWWLNRDEKKTADWGRIL
jgi:hypothetical protein